MKYRLRVKKPRTVNNVLTVLSMMLKKAVEWRVLDHTPWTVKLLKVHQNCAAFYGFDQFEALAKAGEQSSKQDFVIVLLGGEAWLRAGEMRALDGQTSTLLAGRFASSEASGMVT